MSYSVHSRTIPCAAGGKQGVNLQQLTTLVRNADFSDSEVQILIDVLLTMQQEGPASKHDWSEVGNSVSRYRNDSRDVSDRFRLKQGKSDPVQKLKKQLAEREKQVADQNEALGGVNAKLKELRAEFNTERSQAQQRIKASEENANGVQMQLQAANGHVKNLTQELQQLKEEAVKKHQVIEDLKALQVCREHQLKEVRKVSDKFDVQINPRCVLHISYLLRPKYVKIQTLQMSNVVTF